MWLRKGSASMSMMNPNIGPIMSYIILLKKFTFRQNSVPYADTLPSDECIRARLGPTYDTLDWALSLEIL